MKKSLQISLAGIITALLVVLLYLGGLVWFLAYVMPVICGLIMIVSISSLGNKISVIVYICSSILSVFLLNDKECALLYALFFGYYPILKQKIDGINSSIIKWILKLLLFNFSVVIVEIICVYLLGIPFDNSFGKLGIIILLLCANLVFVLYERLFGMVLILYDKRIKKLILKYIK